MQRKHPERISRSSLMDVVSHILKDSPSGDAYEAFCLSQIETDILPRILTPAVCRYFSQMQIRNKEMTIKVSSAALKANLLQEKSKIIREINAELGEEFVCNIVFL